MSFSRFQQRIYRAAVHKAWLLHCRGANIETGARKDRGEYAAAHRAWYWRELREELGIDATAILDSKRDFIRCMAHFERLAGESTYWQGKSRAQAPA